MYFLLEWNIISSIDAENIHNDTFNTNYMILDIDDIIWSNIMLDKADC